MWQLICLQLETCLSHQFLLGKCLHELAQKPARVALAWHQASGSTPYWGNYACSESDSSAAWTWRFPPSKMLNCTECYFHSYASSYALLLHSCALETGFWDASWSRSAQLKRDLCHKDRCGFCDTQSHTDIEHFLLGRSPHKNCKNDLDDQTWRELE